MTLQGTGNLNTGQIVGHIKELLFGGFHKGIAIM